MGIKNYFIKNKHGSCKQCFLSDMKTTNLVKSCFLLKVDPASTKLEIVSLPAQTRWVSCPRIIWACRARWSKTFILLAVRLSMFNCNIIKFRNFLTIYPEKGSLCVRHASPRPNCRLAGSNRTLGEWMIFHFGKIGFQFLWLELSMSTDDPDDVNVLPPRSVTWCQI